ncbi:hypothetical protein [Bradyrhizobium sp. SZCCHNR3118]|uniref:hypothetical protein n=1 Tax=Bradyrhizobium sp. SZCCHNR3118 TaxID=3057468 RepID=UPI0029169EAA|nr:hypothetical protein [Bradyrhizobium sp. SZCCHNR3118]
MTKAREIIDTALGIEMGKTKRIQECASWARGEFDKAGIGLPEVVSTLQERLADIEKAGSLEAYEAARKERSRGPRPHAALEALMLQDTIKFLEDLADTLDRWARESRFGGWSTHHVDANRREADSCRRKAAELRHAIRSNEQPFPEGAMKPGPLVCIASGVGRSTFAKQ